MSDQPKPGENWGPYVANDKGWFGLGPNLQKPGATAQCVKCGALHLNMPIDTLDHFACGKITGDHRPCGPCGGELKPFPEQ